MRLNIIDCLTDPGNPQRVNDDAFCHGERFAAVFDGATGLGGEKLIAEAGSDAAWIASLAAEWFEKHGDTAPVADMVRQVCQIARDEVAARHSHDSLPRYAWPCSGFEMAKLSSEGLELFGLGDCVAYVQMAGGGFLRHCPMPDNREMEQASARRMLDRFGGIDPASGSILRDGEALERMRAGRNTHNTSKGVWTLGLEPAAADAIATVSVPAQKGSQILLMSDGFAAAAEGYGMAQPETLIGLAGEIGLGEILARLRHFERVEDPMAKRFARYKVCDDATAILAEIA